MITEIFALMNNTRRIDLPPKSVHPLQTTSTYQQTRFYPSKNEIVEVSTIYFLPLSMPNKHLFETVSTFNLNYVFTFIALTKKLSKSLKNIFQPSIIKEKHLVLKIFKIATTYQPLKSHSKDSNCKDPGLETAARGINRPPLRRL
jgi:hypothetical protein